MPEAPSTERNASTGADRIAFRKMLENAACASVAGDFAFTGRTLPLILDAIEPLIRADERSRWQVLPLDSKADVVHADGTHDYWSTHCRHDNPEACASDAGGRRPACCKTCWAPCRCVVVPQ
jgi:hypothetical protein